MERFRRRWPFASLVVSSTALLLAILAFARSGSEGPSDGKVGVGDSSFSTPRGSARLVADKDGSIVVMAFDKKAGKEKPVLQIATRPESSVGGRTGVPHWREKVFFHGFGNASTPRYREFLEFRSGSVFPEPDDAGLGGFLFDKREGDLVLWTENFRPLSIATPSWSVSNDVGELAARRLTIGAGRRYRDVPITIRRAYLQVAKGPRLSSEGLDLSSGSFVRLAGYPSRPPGSACARARDRGRLALGGSALYLCAGREPSWRPLG